VLLMMTSRVVVNATAPCPCIKASITFARRLKPLRQFSLLGTDCATNIQDAVLGGGGGRGDLGHNAFYQAPAAISAAVFPNRPCAASVPAYDTKHQRGPPNGCGWHATMRCFFYEIGRFALRFTLTNATGRGGGWQILLARCIHCVGLLRQLLLACGRIVTV